MQRVKRLIISKTHTKSKIMIKKDKPIKIRIPRFFIPEDIARKARGLVKNSNVIKKLKCIK